MASLSKRPGGKNGIWEIQFYRFHKKESISLPASKITEKTADAVKEVVETILYNEWNSIEKFEKRTLALVRSFDRLILEKLEKVGLIKIPKRYSTGELWESYLQERTDEIKNATLETYSHAKRRFFLFFRENEIVSELPRERMLQWKIHLGKTLSGATVAGTLSKAKAVFNWAVESGWIEKSPLDGVGRGSFVNKSKDRHIDPEEYRRLLEVCPCQEWRAIIALARIGGLRCPSEVLRLRWSDIDWKQSRFCVRSPKTEHHEGKETRIVPLFRELRLELERLFENRPGGESEFVINRYRDPERTNLGTQFGRIAQMAGMTPIPKPFNNLRASRSTEIYAQYGPFLESRWIGHSPQIAKDHYLQVREEDFRAFYELI